MSELATKEVHVSDIDRTIDLTTSELIRQIAEDRKRAEDTYLELFTLFNQGKNSPDDVRELNKAQELVHSTTEQMQKLLANLTKLKVGADKVQIANINTESSTGKLTPGALLDMLEEAQESSILQVKEYEVEIPSKRN